MTREGFRCIFKWKLQSGELFQDLLEISLVVVWVLGGCVIALAFFMPDVLSQLFALIYHSEDSI